VLDNEFGEVESSKYFQLSSLIFEKDIEIIFEDAKEEIILKDKIIHTPIYQIKRIAT
jgi:hypothetical protein